MLFLVTGNAASQRGAGDDLRVHHLVLFQQGGVHGLQHRVDEAKQPFVHGRHQKLPILRQLPCNFHQQLSFLYPFPPRHYH